MEEIEDEDWAWLAGIYEGEGTLAFHGKTGVQIRIAMTDEDVIDSVHRLLPMGGKWQRETKGRIKPLYVWQVSSCENCRYFLNGVMPFLHQRRGDRASEALRRLMDNPGAKKWQTHCRYGHPLSGDNLYVAAKTGARSCKTCRARRDRERQR